MSKLQELINKLCPNGVEFKPLGEVCEILDSKRKPVSKGQRINGKYPYYGANGVLDYVSDFIFDGTFLLLGEDGSVINKDNSPVLNWAKGKIWVNNHAHVLSEKKGCLLRFLYYALQLIDVTDIVRGTPPKLNQTNLRNISIPVPPIEVQEEIVRILDSFSDYAAELQAELQARKQQYEYYRNLLLTFNPSAYGCGTDDEQKDGVTTWGGHNYKIEWKKMGEICNRICSGGTPTTSNKSFYNGSIPWLRTQEVNWSDVYDTEIKISEEAVKKSSAKLIPSNCVIIAMYGATAAKVCINRIPLTTNQACCNLEINPQLASYKYVYYWLCNSYEKLKSMGEGSQNNINGMKIKQYPIPIPPLELQEKIVAILDRFETLVNDLTNGLPAEIAAVKDQYEYYRNKLLTFKKLSA